MSESETGTGTTIQNLFGATTIQPVHVAHTNQVQTMVAPSEGNKMARCLILVLCVIYLVVWICTVLLQVGLYSAFEVHKEPGAHNFWLYKGSYWLLELLALVIGIYATTTYTSSNPSLPVWWTLLFLLIVVLGLDILNFFLLFNASLAWFYIFTILGRIVHITACGIVLCGIRNNDQIPSYNQQILSNTPTLVVVRVESGTSGLPAQKPGFDKVIDN